MDGVNHVILLGNCGKEPEIKATQQGKTVAVFSLATSESYRNQTGERNEKTEWHNLVAYDKIGDVVKSFVHKGSRLYIEGKLQTRSWDSPENKKMYRTEIVVQSIKLQGDTNRNSTTTSKSDSAQQTQTSTQPVTEAYDAEENIFGVDECSVPF